MALIMKQPLIVITLTAVLSIASCSDARRMPVAQSRQATPTQKDKVTNLTEEEAIALAEKFIALNGYTDLPPDKESITHESIESEGNLDQLLRIRHDTLERKAFGTSISRKSGSPGWTVVFSYKNDSGPESRKN